MTTDTLREWRMNMLWEMIETSGKPTEFTPAVDEVQFRRLYKRRKIFASLGAAEYHMAAKQTFYCRDCAEELPTGFIAMAPMTAVYEEDPLKAFITLITLTCHMCGFSEVLPVEGKRWSEMTNERAQLRKQFYQLVQEVNGPTLLTGTRPDIPESLSELRQRVKDLKQQYDELVVPYQQRIKMQAMNKLAQAQSQIGLAAQAKLAQQLQNQIQGDSIFGCKIVEAKASPPSFKKDQSLYDSLRDWARGQKK